MTLQQGSQDAQTEAATRGRRKSMVGIVVSNKMDKTAVVAVERRRPHPLYRKIVRSTKRYKAHDPNNTAVLGDVVRIEETRPLSKEKRWRIAETLTRGNVADVAPRDIGAPEGALIQPIAPPPPTPPRAAAVEAETPVAAAPPATELAADTAEAAPTAEAVEVTATEPTAEAAAEPKKDSEAEETKG